MDNTQIQTLWEQIFQELEKSLTSVVCDTWLRPLKPVKLTATSLELSTSTDFAKKWIEDSYLKNIKQAAQKITQKNLKIIISSSGDKSTYFPEDQQITLNYPPVEDQVVSANPSSEMTPPSSTAPLPISPGDASSLNPKYTFDTFVTGNSNRFAHAAALAVAERPAEVYNPFFMYGGVGLGKTHLMHAIGHKILKNHPEMRVLYISSEKFTNELINSIRDGTPEAFRQKYRNIDVLLVDDIQFLSKKEHTQEEFFHTFNTLHDANKQIIISSDRHPREIQTLEDRLRSRFEWGLITDIQAPDLETRIAILRKKALLENLTVPNDVMVYIASRIDNNIRELEGALTRVMAFASLNKEPISKRLAAEALQNVFTSGETKTITLELIQEIVATYFKIDISELIAKKRTRNLAFPRQIAMYLCRTLTDASLPRIGEVFGGRDHTTVLHAYDKISRQSKTDTKLQNTLEDLTNHIKNI